jgi:hypothetical protein
MILLFVTPAFAERRHNAHKGDGHVDTINWSSELSHLAGGTVVAGVSTAVANKYWPEHRALIGFSVGTAYAIISNTIDYVTLDRTFSSQLEDMAFDTLGAAIGSLITDKFILMPVIKRDHAGSSYYGLVLQYSF